MYYEESEVELPESERVLVAQNLHHERLTPEALDREIQEHTEILEELDGHMRAVAESIQNSGDVAYALKASRAFRHRVERRYGMDTRFVGERIHNRMNVVLVAEEEEKEQKNLFTKIIDAIANAFKWLWKKVVSLFGGSADGEDKGEEKRSTKREKLEKKAKDKLDKFSSKGDGVKDAKVDDSIMDKYGKTFGFLGSSVGGQEILKYVEDIDRIFERAGAAVEQANFAYTVLENSLDKILSSPTAEVVQEARKTLNEEFSKVAEKLDRSSGDELNKLGALKAGTKPMRAWSLKGFPGGSVLYVYNVEKGKGLVYKTDYFTPSGDYKGVVKAETNPEVLKAIQDAAVSSFSKIASVETKALKIAEENQSRQDAFIEKLKKLEEKANSDEQARAVIGSITSYLQSSSSTVGGLMVSAGRALRASGLAMEEAIAYTITSIDAVLGSSSGDKETEEEKK